MGETLRPVSSEADELLAPSRARTLAGAVGAPLAFVIVWFADLPLEPAAHRLAAIFGAVLIAWVTEVIPIAATALLIAPLLVVTGVENAKDAFKSYADPLLYLFVGRLLHRRVDAPPRPGPAHRRARSSARAGWPAYRAGCASR